MNKFFYLLPLFISINLQQGYSQDFNTASWNLMKDKPIQFRTITQTEEFSIDRFTFKISWNKELSYSDNIGYYGGIEKMEIYTKGRHIQTLHNIEDKIALGEIYLRFYDYNMDGHIDFTIPIDCGKICWEKYFLFNPELNKFEHIKDWDYLRIQKINKEKLQILSQSEGTALKGQKILYEVSGFQLKKLKVVKYP